MSTNQLPEYFWADRLTPVNYFGYTSATRDRIYELETHYDKKNPDIIRFNDLKRKCLMMCVDMRMNHQKEPVWMKDIWDNKIVIECRTEAGEHIFVGFYDGTYSIGLSMYSKDGRDARPYKEISSPEEMES